MSVDTFSLFFALLSLAAWTGTVLVVVLVLLERSGVGGDRLAFVDDIRRNALWFGWIVAAVTTAGSLYYSEVAHFVPCPLCWYQRICMYPMAVILLVAAVRRDAAVRWYVLVQLGVGLLVAAYHTQLQAYPPTGGSPFCTTTEPCTTRFVWEFGFVSIPFMSLAAFAFVTVMVLVARPDRNSAELPEPQGAR